MFLLVQKKGKCLETSETTFLPRMFKLSQKMKFVKLRKLCFKCQCDLQTFQNLPKLKRKEGLVYLAYNCVTFSEEKFKKLC